MQLFIKTKYCSYYKFFYITFEKIIAFNLNKHVHSRIQTNFAQKYFFSVHYVKEWKKDEYRALYKFICSALLFFLICFIIYVYARESRLQFSVNINFFVTNIIVRITYLKVRKYEYKFTISRSVLETLSFSLWQAVWSAVSLRELRLYIRQPDYHNNTKLPRSRVQLEV